eukprot:COSAG01_NODE_10097_length_2251_cov_4.927974_2_plen_88_part_00
MSPGWAQQRSGSQKAMMAATTALVLASLTRVSYGCWDSALLRGHHKQPPPWLCLRCARSRDLRAASGHSPMAGVGGSQSCVRGRAWR